MKTDEKRILCKFTLRIALWIEVNSGTIVLIAPSRDSSSGSKRAALKQ